MLLAHIGASYLGCDNELFNEAAVIMMEGTRPVLYFLNTLLLARFLPLHEALKNQSAQLLLGIKASEVFAWCVLFTIVRFEIGREFSLSSDYQGLFWLFSEGRKTHDQFLRLFCFHPTNAT